MLLLRGALPLVLVAWIGTAPPRSVLGFWVQVAATAIALCAIGLAGLWAFLPRWTPWLFGGLLPFAILAGLRRRRRLAPCAGAIVATVGGLPDMPVPQTDRASLTGPGYCR